MHPHGLPRLTILFNVKVVGEHAVMLPEHSTKENGTAVVIATVEPSTMVKCAVRVSIAMPAMRNFNAKMAFDMIWKFIHILHTYVASVVSERFMNAHQVKRQQIGSVGCAKDHIQEENSQRRSKIGFVVAIAPRKQGSLMERNALHYTIVLVEPSFA